MKIPRLSQIVAGTMNWGEWGKRLSPSEMEVLINICLESNITSFDHADIYGDYTTESDFGVALSGSSIRREHLQIISKCGIQHVSPSRSNKIKHYNYSSDYIIWSVETSLKNLKTDYLDVLLLHRPSPLMHPEEIAGAVYSLLREGKILSFGLSNFSPSQTDLIRACCDVQFNQIQFSATHHQAMTDGSLDHMIIHQIKPMAWNPLGTIFREDTEQTRRLKIRLSELVARYEVGADTILLAWILMHPSNIIPIAGTVNVARLRQLNKASELVMDLEDWFSIFTASMGTDVP